MRIERAEFVQSILPFLEKGVTFVAYCLPADDEVFMLVDDGHSPVASSRKFLISTWSGQKIEISDRAVNFSDRAVDLHELTAPDFDKDVKSISSSYIRGNTSREEYVNIIDKVTKLLESTEGKVVISRQKLVADSRLDFNVILSAIADMFAAYRNAFRAVYFTPLTGAWCVCSPELLLQVDKTAGKISTVALAGTRKADVAGAWDAKNIKEHSYVVRHIADVLSANGISPVVSDMETLKTGNIRHILTRISGVCSLGVDNELIDRLLQSLNPTPAICGYPIQWSRRIIDELESHNRECYGGYIAVDADNLFYSHVNLRCFAFGNGACCFWGGGGIMPDSTPETEWAESELKIDSTLSYLRKALSEHD